MEKYISILGVLIAVMLILFFAVAKFMGANSSPPSFGSCDQIEDLERRTICLKDLATKTLDVTPCLQIERTFDRDVCLRNVAIKSKDSSLCQQIVTPDIRRICLNDFG
ncbi:MAG: hypothetical protein V1909_04775 [Candidatus Micrarchaeota archaeon]